MTHVIRGLISAAAFVALLGLPLIAAGYAAGRIWNLCRRDPWRWPEWLAFWLLVMVASGAIALWLWKTTAHMALAAWRDAIGRRRADRGLCPSCGYDLRASPGRCPECGT